jgi:hypothetical protein
MKQATMSIVLVLLMCLSLSGAALASDSGGSSDSEQFVPMTREEYITSKAAGQGVDYETAEAELDAKIAAAVAALPTSTISKPSSGISTRSWEIDTSIDNGDTTYTSYGRIYKIYTDPNGLKVRYSVDAVKLRSNHGAQWIEINASSAWVQPEGSTNYEFYGSPTANKISTTQVRLAVTGYFQLTKSEAVSGGINVGIANSTVTVSGTTYYRINASDVHIETA